ncbi:MAG: Flp pilus assembly protein CpaB [Steroidobacteraceae bacterium]
MNYRNWWRWKVRADAVLLMVAILAGITGAVLSGRFLGAKAAATEATLRERYEAKAVVVAAADLPRGEPLDATRLAVRKMPKEFLPEDAVPVERAGELIGARTAIQIRRGTPVVQAALHTGSPPQRLSMVLAGERRALTIAVDQANSQAGNLAPGDWVDLYYSRSSGGDAVLAPLLQHVEVLATGAALLGDDADADSRVPERNFGTITLGLSATDAVRVVLAQQSGSLSVVLRASTDTSQISSEPRSSRELLVRPSRSRNVPGDSRVEVLIGGSGGLTPEQSWLAVGQGRLAASGDPS